MRDQNQPVGQGNRRDGQVIRSDSSATPLQLIAHASKMHASQVIKWNRDERLAERFDLLLDLRLLLTTIGSVPQLGDDNGTERNAVRRCVCQPCGNAGVRAAPQDLHTGIRIE
jgi:hypothetical protein